MVALLIRALARATLVACPRTSRVGALGTVLLAVVGCSASPATHESGQSPSFSAASPSATPGDVQGAPPSLAPAPTPLATPRKSRQATPLPSISHLPRLGTCAPPGGPLPDDAIAALVCTPKAANVERVEIYAVLRRSRPYDWLVAAMEAAGHSESAACHKGEQGIQRLGGSDNIGCFVDEQGHATIHFVSYLPGPENDGYLTRGRIIARNRDLALLADWAMGGDRYRAPHQLVLFPFIK